MVDHTLRWIIFFGNSAAAFCQTFGRIRCTAMHRATENLVFTELCGTLQESALHNVQFYIDHCSGTYWTAVQWASMLQLGVARAHETAIRCLAGRRRGGKTTQEDPPFFLIVMRRTVVMLNIAVSWSPSEQCEMHKNTCIMDSMLEIVMVALVIIYTGHLHGRHCSA